MRIKVNKHDCGPYLKALVKKQKDEIQALKKEVAELKQFEEVKHAVQNPYQA